MIIKRIVADAGLLLPEAGTVDLDKFDVDLWYAPGDEEADLAIETGIPGVICTRAQAVGKALTWFKDVGKDEMLFLSRRVNFIGKFVAGAGTTCGEWTRPVDNAGRKGFFKGNPALGVCPVQCDFCYLRGVPFATNSIALNVGEYAEQVSRKRKVRGRSVLPKIINLSETGGPIEWAVEYKLQGLIQAYTDATLAAGIVPYWLTKKHLTGVNFKGAHIGISLNPWAVMSARSPGADCPNDLLQLLANAGFDGASTVIRWGPIIPGYEREYDELADVVADWGLDESRITVDLLRYSPSHPDSRQAGFYLRAKKYQETVKVQRAHLQRVRDYFPHAHITCCKVQPSVAVRWVREGLIQSFPCACWV